VLPPEPGLAYPVCKGGKRRKPPEDCGDIPGYYNLMKAISDPTTANMRNCRNGLATDFDPAALSIDDVNRRLAHLQCRLVKG